MIRLCWDFPQFWLYMAFLITLSICKWIDFASGCIQVNIEIANLVVLSSSTFVWFFCFFAVHGSPAVCLWQDALQLWLEATEVTINWVGGEIAVVLLDSIRFSIHCWISSLIFSDNATRALKLFISTNSRISWRCKDWCYKCGGRTAIAIDVRRHVCWVICLNETSDRFSRSWLCEIS